MVDIVLYRMRIGCFTMPRKIRNMIRGLQVSRRTVSLCLRLFIAMAILIVASGDVEQNPGPPKNYKQSHLSFDAQDASFSNTPVETRTRHNRKNAEKESYDSVMSFLRDMKKENNDNFGSVNVKIDGINSQINEIKLTNDELRKENQELRAEVNNLKINIDKIEAQSRRNNLRFKGIDGMANEDWGVSEEKIRQFIKNDLNMPDMENVEIERAHRVGSRSNPTCPIIVKFQKYKDKERVLKQSKSTLTRDSPHSVHEDFTQRVLNHRRELGKSMIEARQEGKYATISYDKLIIDNDIYKYDDLNDKIVHVGSSRGRSGANSRRTRQSRDTNVNGSQHSSPGRSVAGQEIGHTR